MKTIHSLLLASAVAVSFGALSITEARADYYHDTVIIKPAANQQVTQQSFVAVGTRKVGIVGSRPYPIEASRVESSTVQTTRVGNHAHTEVTTTTTATPTPVNFQSGGGVYYTDQTGARYYADPALNVVVRPSGSFND